MDKKTVVVGLVVCLLLGTASVLRADDVPPATAPATFVDSDVVKDWNGSFALGLNIAKGNSDTLLFNAGVSAEKLWRTDEWHMGADGAYGINNWGHREENKSVNSIHGAVDYRHLFSERFYGGAALDLLHDDISDVSYRAILSPLAGYYFIKEPETRFRGEIGPALIAEKVGGNEVQRFALRLSERFERDFSKTAKFWEQVDYLPHVDDFGNYLLLVEVGVEAALNTRLSLRVVAQDKFNSQPPTDRERNDLTLLAALVYKFAK